MAGVVENTCVILFNDVARYEVACFTVMDATNDGAVAKNSVSFTDKMFIKRFDVVDKRQRFITA